MPEQTHFHGTYGDYAAITKADKALYGGKGAGLLEMTCMGLPVPEALILTTDAWKYYRETGHLRSDTFEAIERFVMQDFPTAMFSVRSGAPISMPGMMDTLLNVGVGPNEDAIYPGCFSRFVTGWLEIVRGIDKKRVKDLLFHAEMFSDSNLGASSPRELILKVLDKATDVSVPTDRLKQVVACVCSVFDSWDTPRAKAYRAMHEISEDMGTGCVIQRMVMGTAKGLSGSGVMFSRNPATGDLNMTGEIAFDAQGEEVVSGAVTPVNLDTLMEPDAPGNYKLLHNELVSLCTNLETYYDDVQDVEFTVENGALYVLQTRTAKMSARARIVTACDFAAAKAASLGKDYLKARVTRGMVAQTKTPTVKTDDAPLATGLAASPGAISGKIVFRSTPLDKITKNSILVCEDTAPDDFPQMARSGGIFTATGGFTCHSAVVARGIGVPAVVGCAALSVDNAMKSLCLTGPDGKPTYLKEGDEITIDGATGAVYPKPHEVSTGSPPRELYDLLHNFVLSSEELPVEVYYKDCSVGDYVALTLNPSDVADAERQLKRADKYLAKGKVVGFILDVPGLGEDLIFNSIPLVFSELKECLGADFAGHRLLGGLPSFLMEQAAEMMGMDYTPETVAYIDLLDLLD